jgi:hypothetical protein
LKLVIADEQQLAIDRYQSLRRMIVEHLEHCPLREEKSETLGEWGPLCSVTFSKC